MNHASWLDAWDRGLIVPASAAMQWKGRSLNRPPSFLFIFQIKKQYKEIRLSDETKQPPTVPTRPLPIFFIKTENLSKMEPSLGCQTNEKMENFEYNH